MPHVRLTRILCVAASLLASSQAHAQTVRPEATPPAASVELAPLELVARAVARWQARPRPARLSYTVDFDGKRKGGTYMRRFRVEYVAQSREARITELASQGDPPPFVEPEKQRIFPDDTFGFVPREKAGGASDATARDAYDVRLRAREPLDGKTAYHLQFVPKAAPDTNVLRDVWIDAQSYDVVRLAVERSERFGPVTVPYVVTASYAEDGPYWLVHRIEGSGSMHTPLFSYTSSATATFVDLRYEP